VSIHGYVFALGDFFHASIILYINYLIIKEGLQNKSIKHTDFSKKWLVKKTA
jgi:hypothetical protein